MEKKQETFDSLMMQFQYHFDLPVVFDDLLTMAIAAFGRNLDTGLSYDEDLYTDTLQKYKGHRLIENFPKMLGSLIVEMENRRQDSQGNDVLGDFYQEHLYKKGRSQFFTPWHVCQMIAQMTFEANPDAKVSSSPQRILDPCCGSGRLLVAGSRVHGIKSRYFGIDLDHTCVKMSALNMFLNGIFHGEVMWADALMPDDFKMSYKLSFFPFGIFRIEHKEDSLLWQINQNTFKSKEMNPGILPSDESHRMDGGMQLQFF